jgi:hypothetical protein
MLCGDGCTGWRELKVLIMLCCCVMLWCNFLYVPVGVLGYRAFGSEASSNILDNFGTPPYAMHQSAVFLSSSSQRFDCVLVFVLTFQRLRCAAWALVQGNTQRAITSCPRAWPCW